MALRPVFQCQYGHSGYVAAIRGGLYVCMMCGRDIYLPPDQKTPKTVVWRYRNNSNRVYRRVAQRNKHKNKRR